MNPLVISVKDEDVGGQDIMTIFDEQLRHAMSAQESVVIMCIRAEMGCSTVLLEWLEGWSDRFSKVSKQLFIIPSNVNQLECLEVSHPDLELKYAPSLEDLQARLGPLVSAPEASVESEMNADASLSPEKSVERAPAFQRHLPKPVLQRR